MSANLHELTRRLEELAPLELAADWDNVGMLLEPAPQASASTRSVLLTIDLTPGVLNEAISRGTRLIVSYHPPIFSTLKRISFQDPMSRTLLGAVTAGIFIYSPHTALDAAPGGLTDWLAEAVSDEPCLPIIPSDVNRAAGQGRQGTFASGVPLEALQARIKSHLGLQHLRVATPAGDRGRAIQSFAVCAGAGGSVLEAATSVDLVLTGEMRHHDILSNIARGTSVVVCDHTHTERGYLPRLAERLRQVSDPDLEVFVAASDVEPLRVV
jgi:dinuclear metal center YbgI/SA1388 family protein